MKESIGTAWIMTIVMTFIALFASFLAYSVSYSKSFRVKDGIIERINKHNGFDNNSTLNTLDDIDAFLSQVNYSAKGNCNKIYEEYADAKDASNYQVAGVTIGTSTNNTEIIKNKKHTKNYNYCVVKVKKATGKTARADVPSAYYKVVVFFSLQIGNATFGANLFKTSGETATLYYPNDVIFK